MVKLGINSGFETLHQMAMESENEASLDVVSGKNRVELPVESLKEEKLNVVNGEAVPDANYVSENPTTNGTVKVSGAVLGEVAVAGSESKTSKKVKGSGIPNGDVIKNNKPKTSMPHSHNQRPVLSQSLSFPSRGLHAVCMKKSVGVTPLKVDTKTARGNGPKVDASSAEKSSYHCNRRASTGAIVKEPNTNGGSASAHCALLSKPSFQRTLSGKSGSANATINCPPSKACISADESPKAGKLALSIKDDEDVHSTSSCTPRGSRRSSGSGFSFRLEERAEKRKEFFMKMEEKIHAKEVEKTNLQAKTKESQEAEIKQLRKSLTFKAAPMPSFYKEPPPKVELKKIPTTCPISPKLGRNKSSTPATNKSSEGGSTLSPHVNRDHSNLNKKVQATPEKDASKKPIQKSLSKLPSRKSIIPKAEVKPPAVKAKTQEAESSNSNLDKSHHCLEKPEVQATVEVNSKENPPATEEEVIDSSTSVIIHSEIAVGG
ncbi:TPX2, C-terminal [Dillenia turbinata]|uniref:TPX2, C-terminal n=1 Tax=Dillenia turbinata TaxID=194707 RepID=A0AAN8WAW8_9MAGN